MNKFTLLAFVATAFAKENCATADDLNKANFERYELKYYIDKNDLTKGTIPIGFDVNCGKNRWCLQSNQDTNTTFKIKGASKGNTEGFRIYSEDEKKVLSFNQRYFGGYGFYMYDKEADYLEDGYYSDYTLMNYEDDKILQGLAQKPLGVSDNGNETHIFQAGLYPNGSVEETKFCFIKKTSLARFFGYIAETAGKTFKESFGEVFPEVYSVFKDSKANWTEEMKTKAFDSAQKEIQSQMENAVKAKSTALMDQLKLKLEALKDPEKRQEMFEMLKKGQPTQQPQPTATTTTGTTTTSIKEQNIIPRNRTVTETAGETATETAGETATGTATRAATGTASTTATETEIIETNTGTQNALLQSQEQQRQHDQNPKKVEKESKALLQEQQQQQPQYQQTQQQPQQQRTQEQQEQQKDNIPPNEKDAGSSVHTPFALCSLALLLFVTY